MDILCNKCVHESVCAYAKDFERIINRINNVYLIVSTKVSDVKHLDDFEWISYTPHCEYFCESNPISRNSQSSLEKN